MKKLIVLLIIIVLTIGALAEPPKEKKVRWDIGWPTWPLPDKK